MISAWEVYLFTRLDAVGEALTGFLVISIISSAALIFFAIGATIEKFDSASTIKKFAQRSAIITICFIVLKVAVPTTNQFVVIYLLPKIANNEQVQKVPENFVKLLNAKMEAWIADFEKEKKK